MRKILFKAKRIDNGEWIEGYYVVKQDPSYTDIENHYILLQERDSCGCLMSCTSWVKVIPETVCQDTGLTDKNKVNIFDKDIVKITLGNGKSYNSKVFYKSAMYKLTTLVAGSGVSLCTASGYWSAKVIGNIFDNPELLENQRVEV